MGFYRRNPGKWGLEAMYYRDDKEQLSIDEFFMPFGGRLMKDNRWVRLAEMMPWEHIEEIYAQNMSEETGRPAIPSRIAFGAIFIKEYCHIGNVLKKLKGSDEERKKGERKGRKGNGNEDIDNKMSALRE